MWWQLKLHVPFHSVSHVALELAVVCVVPPTTPHLLHSVYHMLFLAASSAQLFAPPEAIEAHKSMVASFGKTASGDALEQAAAQLHEGRLSLFTARLFRHFKELASKKVELRIAVQATMADMKKASLGLDNLHDAVKAKCSDALRLRY